MIPDYSKISKTKVTYKIYPVKDVMRKDDLFYITI